MGKCDGGLPGISRLQDLSKVFGITIDYLLDDENQLPALSMKKELNKDKYKNKMTMYKEILDDYYPKPYEVYSLIRTKKMNVVEHILDTFIAPEIGPVSTADQFGYHPII